MGDVGEENTPPGEEPRREPASLWPEHLALLWGSSVDSGNGRERVGIEDVLSEVRSQRCSAKMTRSSLP